MSLEEVKAKVNKAMGELKPLFTPDCKLTFIMRKPGSEDCYMSMTEDTPEELIKLFGHIKKQSGASIIKFPEAK